MKLNSEALAAIAERSGLTRLDLARLTGLSKQYVSDLCLGKRGALPATVKTLADALKVPITAIVREPCVHAEAPMPAEEEDDFAPAEEDDFTPAEEPGPASTAPPPLPPETRADLAAIRALLERVERQSA